MARVTVEDCVVQVPNRFELVMLAAKRARNLSSGAELRVERDRDKNPVVALREIAEEKLDLGSLKETLIKGLQRRIEPDQPEEEVAELMAGEQQSWIQADMGAEDGDEDFDLDETDEVSDDSDLSKGAVHFEDADLQD